MTSLLQVFGERARFSELEPLAVIDIGSNSVRLVVYEGAVRAATPLFNEKVLCGLGRSIATTGKLGKESVERALAALTRFRAVIRVLRVKNVRAIATAAVRDAADGAEFITRGQRACGTKIEVLSGEKEAELAAQGIRMGFQEPDGIAGDLGGGSLELIDIYKDDLNEAATLPLGGLRLIDMTGDRIEKALPLVDEALARMTWLERCRGRVFYAVGGTWRSLARLHMEQADYPLRVMHGYAIPTNEAIAFCETVRKTRKITQLPGIQTVAKPRREVLPYGALVLERLMRVLQPSEIVFSVSGIREGLLYSLLPEHERKKDPLLSFCEDLARLRSRSVEHAYELCTWTDALFADPGPRETAAERRLRHAACLISDIGWRGHPDYRGEQTLSLLAHAALGGLDHPGRIFLALAVYFRHVGPGENDVGELPERLIETVTRRLVKRARIVGAAVRTAHMLSIGTAGVIDETPLTYEGDQLALNIPKAYAGLDGERLRRRLEYLASLVDRQAAVHVGANR